jgi:hypothetical protein
MEKTFSSNRLFVYFCAALIIIWVGLQLVSNSLMSALAERDGVALYQWQWPQFRLHSTIDSLKTEVVSRSPTEAVVKIVGRQRLCREATNGKSWREVGKPTDVSAVLTYYQSNKKWILGRVDLP